MSRDMSAIRFQILVSCRPRSFFLALLFSLMPSAFSADAPSPPFSRSKIGYLRVSREVEVPPRAGRVMILPQVESVLFLTDDAAYYLMTPRGADGDVACVVPRNAREELLIRHMGGDGSRRVYFSGALEVETVPILLFKGDELPIDKNLEGGWLVALKRGDDVFHIFVPKKLRGVEFSKSSRFEDFAAVQKTKGLVYLKGRWVGVEVAKREKRAALEAASRSSELWSSMKSAAKRGVVVLKGGTVLRGRLVGVGDRRIMFESSGKDYWLTVNDIASLSESEMLAWGRMDSAEASFREACPLVVKAPGLALYHLDKAEKMLRPLCRESGGYERASDILADVLSTKRGIESSLDVAGRAVYHYAVFKKEVLAAHLAAGHVLLDRKYWLDPEQVCATCHGSGETRCPDCHGKGWRKVDCAACVDGRVVCPVCGGSGFKDCSYCGGKGVVYRPVHRNRYFFGTGVCAPMQTGGASVTVLSNGKVVVVTRPYIYPVCGGMYLNGDFSDEGVENVVCPVCHGRGALFCPKTVKCSKCHGVGYFIKRCSTCDGKGRVSCPDCDGKGFHGAPRRIDLEKPKGNRPVGGSAGVSRPVP